MIQMQEILDMSVAERILMIEKIWDSINPDEINLSSAHMEELERRMSRYERGETSFVTWDSVKAELRSAKL